MSILLSQSSTIALALGTPHLMVALAHRTFHLTIQPRSLTHPTSEYCHPRTDPQNPQDGTGSGAQPQPGNGQHPEQLGAGGGSTGPHVPASGNPLSQANVQAIPAAPASGMPLGSFARRSQPHEQIALGIVNFRRKAHEAKKL